jgi:hypothetical protein
LTVSLGGPARGSADVRSGQSHRFGPMSVTSDLAQ